MRVLLLRVLLPLSLSLAACGGGVKAAALPASCAGQTTCTVGQCEGSIDQTKRTLGCNCI